MKKLDLDDKLEQALAPTRWREIEALVPGASWAARLPKQHPILISSPNKERSPSKADAKEALKALDERIAALKKLQEPIPFGVADELEHIDRSYEELTEAQLWEKRQEGLKNLADTHLAYAEGVREKLLEEIAEFWPKAARSPHIVARLAARSVAEFYVLGLGKMPTLGGNSPYGRASSVFGRAVQDTFEYLEISASYHSHCETAIERLKAEDCKEFNRLINLRTAVIKGAKSKGIDVSHLE